MSNRKALRYFYAQVLADLGYLTIFTESLNRMVNDGEFMNTKQIFTVIFPIFILF